MRAALLLIGCASLCAQSTLDVSAGLDGMVDRYLEPIAKRQWETRAARVAALRTPAEVRARQEYIRRTLVAEVGGFPEKTPLNPRITGTLERGDYKVEKLIFESQPHYYVTANVFVPANGKPPYPAVLGTAGHSLDGKAAELYESVWVSLAKRGVLVLAYDPPGQGERLEYLDGATGKSKLSGGGTGEHSMAGVQCLLTGTSIARYFIWDGIRAFDYLLTRPDVDPKRIGVAGNSGGGTQSSYLAAFEPRLAAAAPSCYLTSWEKLWSGPGPQDAEQNFANFLKDGLDFPDFLIAFAPKPIQMATATRDFFPIDGAKATFAEAHRIFEVLDAGAHMGFFEFDDTHGWSKPRREATYRWFARWLQDREDDGVEPDSQTRQPEGPAMHRDRPGRHLFRERRNRALAQRGAGRAAWRPGARLPARGTFPSCCGRVWAFPPRAPPSTPSRRGEIERQDYKIEKIEIQPEPGITVPALAFVPSGKPERKPAVLYVNPAGKAADARRRWRDRSARPPGQHRAGARSARLG